MPLRTLLTLADVSFQFGLIGIDEYQARVDLALWVAGKRGISQDPRNFGNELNSELKHEGSSENEDERSSKIGVGTTSEASSDSDPAWLYFTFNKWRFKKSDPDPYPSAPHGHHVIDKQTKLNPYTGRAFKAKHQEDNTHRLSRSEMVTLWGDERFRDFCRSHILWYLSEFPHYRFPVAHPFRFPRPR